VNEPFTTYRLADGELIFGEYSFVTDPDFFDDCDERIEVIKEVWQLVDEQLLFFGPPHVCPECGETVENEGDLCADCKEPEAAT
jgi:hypothetical protein